MTVDTFGTKEKRIMENVNRCVQCTVEQCRYHCKNEDYCSLERVQIGTHESEPSMEQCTDCLSFRARH